jgi:molybdopterin-guanine dinucleotide biosynthesis protein A
MMEAVRPRIGRQQVTGLILAGGQGSRMGGVDKGLQTLRGRPLVEHAIERLQPQVGALAISANRNDDVYRSYGFPVYSDACATDFAGPLAGIAAGLRAATTPWVLVVPCDAPLFPLDLADKLIEALEISAAELAFAATRDSDGTHQRHPVFALLPTRLSPSADAQLASGVRRLGAWYAHHNAVEVSFRETRAFYNANTLQDLQELER